MNKILDFGSLNIDIIYKVDHIVKEGETISSFDVIQSAGGKGANQAAALAKAKAEVYLAGKIGKDGQFLLDLLNDYSVNTSLVYTYEGKTGQAIIQLDKNSQNSIILFAGGNKLITKEEVDEVLNNFASGDYILLQNEISNIEYIIEKAYEKNMIICLNPSPYNEVIESLDFSKVNIVFINEIEGEALAGKKAESDELLNLIIAKYPSLEILLTLGKNGVIYAKGDERKSFGIYDVEVQDTTAAGDTFTGYFIASRAKGETVEKSLELASKASSITVSKLGAMESIPYYDEVISYKF